MVKEVEEIHNVTCGHCGKMYNSEQGLERHLLVHDTETILICGVCQKECSSEKALERHMLIHGTDVPQTDSEESDDFTEFTDIELESEIESNVNEADENRNMFDFIKMEFDEDLEAFEKQETDPTAPVTVKVETCNSSSYRQSLSDLLNEFNSESEVFNPGTVEDEQRSSLGSSQYVTRSEAQSLVSRGFINVKKEPEEIVEKSHDCEICGMEFSSEDEVIRHLVSDHKIVMDEYECDKCGDWFSSEEELGNHMENHKYPLNDGYKIRCEICGKQYSNKATLNVHSKMRHKKNVNNTYPCKFCGKTFTTRMSLSVHLRVHFAVAQEDKTTRMKHKRHDLQSSVERLDIEQQHPCLYCKKHFKSRRGLFHHISRKHNIEIPGRSIKCLECGKFFLWKHSVVRHFKIFHPEVEKPETRFTMPAKSFDCWICGKVYDSSKDLENHMRTHITKNTKDLNHSEKNNIGDHLLSENFNVNGIKPKVNESSKTYNCKKCLMSFAWKENLLRHMENYHKDTKELWVCDRCDDSFLLKCELLNHISITHTGPKDRRSTETNLIKSARTQSVCSHKEEKRSVNSKTYQETKKRLFETYCLERQVYNIKTKGKQVCANCGKSFPSNSCLKSHSANCKALDPKSRVCDICNASFSAYALMEQHKLIHYWKAPELDCRVCGISFQNTNSLTQHMRAHSNLKNFRKYVIKYENGAKRYGCKHCEKSYTEISNWSRHMRLKHMAEPIKFYCHICKKTFIDKPGLVTHLQTYHTECAERFSCKGEGCESFATKHELLLHKEKCTRKQVFRCVVCDLAFSNNGSLVSHLKIHDPERERFYCQYINCNKSYLTKWELKEHIIIRHCVNQEEHQCEMCLKVYNSIRRLRVHRRIVHPENPKHFKCKLCGKCFEMKHRVSKHLSRSHGVAASVRSASSLFEEVKPCAAVKRKMSIWKNRKTT